MAVAKLQGDYNTLAIPCVPLQMFIICLRDGNIVFDCSQLVIKSVEYRIIEECQMPGYQTTWPILATICFGWLALALFLLAGRKVFFEPFRDSKDDSKDAAKDE